MPENKITLPIAIIVAGALIAGAVFVSSYSKNSNANNQTSTFQDHSDFSVNPVSADEHILGNPNARLAIIEFSDTECPFCKSFQPTMKQIIAEYGKTGDVAWIYRHFPLNIHPKSPHEAAATECMAQIKGNAHFWSYLDNIFNTTPSNNGLDPAMLTELAKPEMVNEPDNLKAFQDCLASDKYISKVQADYEDGLKAKVSGTPFSVLLTKSPVSDKIIQDITSLFVANNYRDPSTGELLVKFSLDKTKISISGALPKPAFESVINTVLGK